MQKTYLGDAVYAEAKDGLIVVTTEDGRGVTNTIVLEPEVMDALLSFAAKSQGVTA